MKSGSATIASFLLATALVAADDDKWMREYYKHPAPQEVTTELKQWQKQGFLSNANTAAVMIGFLSQVMHDNPTLVTGWLRTSEKFAEADRQAVLTAAWYSRAGQALDYFAATKVTAFAGQEPPDFDRIPIDQAADLDFYWARYFASGNPGSIRRIVSALEYEKYAGALEKYKASKKTREDERAALFDSIFQAATWSLESNGKNDKNVYMICKELFFSQELNQPEKLWMAMVLAKARPDEFKVKLAGLKGETHLEIVKSPPPTGIDGASLSKAPPSSWQKDGKPIPDSESRKSEKDFGAQLLLTEEAKFFENWAKPETPTLARTDRARRNVPIHTVLLFSNPGLDKSESADVTADVTIRKPDGNTYSEPAHLVCWKGAYKGAPFSLQLGGQHIGIRIEPRDPAGKYSIEAIVHDNIKKVDLELHKTFEVDK